MVIMKCMSYRFMFVGSHEKTNEESLQLTNLGVGTMKRGFWCEDSSEL